MAPYHNFLTNILLLAFLVSTSCAQFFSVEPQDTEVIEGARVVLNCRVINKPSGAQVYWQIPAVTTRFLGPDDTVPAQYAGSYQIIGDRNLDDFNLVINSVTPEDAGIYKCILFLSQRGDSPTEVGSSREAVVRVATLDPSGQPDCWASPKREVFEGDVVDIHCGSSDPQLELVWSRDSEILPSFTNSSTSISTLITSSFQATAAMNGATFTCTTPSVGYTPCDLPLSVFSRPSVTITPVGDIKTGQDGRYRCQATGNPNVFVYLWQYGDEVVQYRYNRRFNMAGLEEQNSILVLPDMQTDDDGVILTCTAINEHGQASTTYPIRVAIDDLTALIAPILCAIIVAIIILLIIGFCCWRAQQKKALKKITTSREPSTITGPIDTEMEGHLNPTFTGFSPLQVDSVGYGPDVKPYKSKPSERDYDTGEPKPIPRQNSSTKSKNSEGSENDFISKDVDDAEEEVQTYTYQVNPNFEEYRNKASYDVNYEDEADDFIKKPLPENDLDLEKELVGELSMFSNYDSNLDQDSEPAVLSTVL